jgi:hypothetical protein
MPFALFQNENVAAGLPINGSFQAGVSDTDRAGLTLERNILIPWCSDPRSTWIYYDVTLANYLDSGIVTHRRLPQIDNLADTLASCAITDANIDTLTGRGVNLQSRDQFADIVQRMGHSRYWFHLFGQAMRAGFQVPIPAAKLVGTVPLIPDDRQPQVAYNKIVGNYSGVPVWHAVWSLWYTLAAPPRVQLAPTAPNLAAHISAGAALPAVGIQSPFTQPDDEATLQLQTGINPPL